MKLRIPKILHAKELADKAFGQASKIEVEINPKDRVNSIRDKEFAKMDAVRQIINTDLKKFHDSYPSIDKLSPVYRELLGIVASIPDLKKSLAALHWAMNFNNDLLKNHRQKLLGSPLKSLAQVRREYYGRTMSVLKQIDKNLKYLDHVRLEFRKLPELQDLPTVVIAGFPNVGKSSLLKALTNAEPEVQPYPFTTKGILTGQIENQVQLIDTPGLLDRPLEKRNKIEMHAVVALKHLANKILFIIDPTETCGYSIEDQLSLLNSIEKELDKPVILCLNKEDLFKETNVLPVKADFTVSSLQNKGIEDLKKHILTTTRQTLGKSFRK